jgi:MFS superfamily sulfate permease-like transporter
MKKNNFGMYIALGAGIGSALGVVFKNIALGVSLGVGLAIMVFFVQQNKNNDSEK